MNELHNSRCSEDTGKKRPKAAANLYKEEQTLETV